MGACVFGLSLLLVCLGIKFVRGDEESADPFVSSQAVGINYGRVGDNLPPPSQAVELMKSINAGYVKIYDADPQVLNALANSGLPMVITVPNDEVPGISSSTTTSDQWLQTNLVPFYPLTEISVIMVWYCGVIAAIVCLRNCSLQFPTEIFLIVLPADRLSRNQKSGNSPDNLERLCLSKALKSQLISLSFIN